MQNIGTDQDGKPTTITDHLKPVDMSALKEELKRKFAFKNDPVLRMTTLAQETSEGTAQGSAVRFSDLLGFAETPLKLLEHSYEIARTLNNDSRLEYLSSYIFDFTTYDGEIDEILARKALEVCKAISNRTTFAYIKNREDYIWYITMCNMPFFEGKLEWGTSIRGAWWDYYRGIEIESCGIWVGYEQEINPINFDEAEWLQFVQAMDDFVKAG